MAREVHWEDPHLERIMDDKVHKSIGSEIES